MTEQPTTKLGTYHAPECPGADHCCACGYVDADDQWHPGPAPEGTRAYQFALTPGGTVTGRFLQPPAEAPAEPPARAKATVQNFLDELWSAFQAQRDADGDWEVESLWSAVSLAQELLAPDFVFVARPDDDDED